MEQAAANALPASEQFDNPLTNDTREDFEAEAAAIRQQLESLPQAREGGYIEAPDTGGLIMAHGAEIVAPLNSPQGKLLNLINEAVGTSVASPSMTVDTMDRSGKMSQAMSSAQSSIQQYKDAATVINQNNVSVVQGGTTISSPSSAISISSGSRGNVARRPDRS